MFKNQMIQLLVDLQKKGIHIHLTEEGYKEFLKLMKNDIDARFLPENISIASNQ